MCEGRDDPSIDEDHHFRSGSRTWSCSCAESAEGWLSESARKFTATGVVAWMDGNITEEDIKLDEEWMHRTELASFQNFNVSLPIPQVVEKSLRDPMISMLAGDRYESAQICCTWTSLGSGCLSHPLPSFSGLVRSQLSLPRGPRHRLKARLFRPTLGGNEDAFLALVWSGA